MMAAITAALRGHSVTLMEKNAQLGVKLALTGGGRCNLTYATDADGIIRNASGNSSFLHSALYTFGSSDLMDFFEKRGVPLKSENGKIFPKSDKAGDIVGALESAMKEYNIRVLLNYPVGDLSEIKADAVIVSTGGCSYPATGSTGDGHKWARSAGHNVTELRPALVPLLGTQGSLHLQSLRGLSVPDVRLTMGKHSAVGDLLFTHNGISGPVVLDMSRYFDGEAIIDFMPHENELDKLLLDEFRIHSNKYVGNIISRFLPKRLAEFLLDGQGVKAHAFTKEARASLIRAIKHFRFPAAGTAGFRQAMVTAGGVDLKEINPSTMESKKVPGLYFVGEVLDIDAPTGGFNLQIAFSTGYTAGNSV